MKTIACLALLFCGAAHAQLAFKGLPLGSDRQALLARYASLECMAVPKGAAFAGIGDELCSDAYCRGPACAASSAALSSYGGAPVWSLDFGIVDGRVEQFSARFDAAAYETLRDALRAAHGAGRERVQPMQTLRGARVDARIWSIELPTGEVSVFERAAKIGEGAVELRSAAFSTWARRAPDVGKSVKGL